MMRTTAPAALKGLAAATRRALLVRPVQRQLVSSKAAGAPAPTILSLPDWVASNGGSLHAGVSIRQTPDQGYGLMSQAELQPGEKLIQLPQSCQLTYDEESSDPKLLALIDKVPTELWGAKLALQLTAQRMQGPASHFAPYITQLPVGVPGVPIFFGQTGIQAIQYPPVSEQVKKRCRWLYDFSQLLSKLPGSAEDPFGGVPVDLNALGWAFACVTSRAFRVRGPTKPAAMLPLIDMANHSFEPNCEVLPVAGSNGAMAMYAKRKIAPGEPLLLSYGALSNDFLFMDYGFIVADNPHDRVTLRWDLDLLEEAALQGHARGADGKPLARISSSAPWKQRFLQQMRLSGPGSNLEVNLGGSQLVEPRVLAALRVLMATSESEIQGRTPARLGDLNNPLSRLNETAVLRTLTGLALVALGNFPTTLEEDTALLEAGPAAQQPSAGQPLTANQLPEDVRQAVQFRVCKKQLLSGVIQALAKRLQQLKDDTSLPATTAPAMRQKGQKPGAATSKGFGAKLS